MYSQTLQKNKLVNQKMQGLDYRLGLEVSGTRSLGFYVYMIFLLSFFLHMPARIQVLAEIRFDLLLMITTLFFVIVDRVPKGGEPDKISKYLYILFTYIIISLPFVKWPGSVINKNLLLYTKAVVFFFFTANVIRTRKDLKVFMTVFILCQVFRVFEPVWLHITTGYWGSATDMGGQIILARLSGSPADVVNPNGLAWVIVSTIPFLFFLTKRKPFIIRMLIYAVLLIFMYALQLTQSRSGLIGLVVVIGGIIWKSKNKVIWIALTVLTAAIIFARLDPLSQDRYLSIYRDDVKGAGTAQARVVGWGSGLKAVFNKPIVGHGLGTSLEVSANVIGRYVYEHNLYLEVLQEIGIIGFAIFMMYLKSIIKSFFIVRKRIFQEISSSKAFLIDMVEALQVWVVLTLTFSMASYGLNEYTWYLFGGISVVLLRLTEKSQEEAMKGAVSATN
jgi:O-antigen ligase